MIAVAAAASIAGSVVVATLAGVVEWIAVQVSLPRRFVWLVGIAISLGLTGTLMFVCAGGILSSRNATFGTPYLVDTCIAVLWPVSSIFCAIQLLRSWRALQRATPHWEPALIENTEVWITDLFGPGTIGVREPRIVLPRWLLRELPQTLAAVLAHERQHVACRDYRWRLFEKIAYCTMPWNIGLRWQLQRLITSVEIDCDARVLRSESIDSLAYSKGLAANWLGWCRARKIDAENPLASSQIRRRLQIIAAGVQ